MSPTPAIWSSMAEEQSGSVPGTMQRQSSIHWVRWWYQHLRSYWLSLFLCAHGPAGSSSKPGASGSRCPLGQ
ncbi:hypothetical protein AB0C28_55895 [Nonomuraea sp. NPDC048892]|uniref:hypothetical protein n=1 Tax=Nonomuraea sp. NPDC048892 TaxID=3154624 RepID=UPI0033CBE77F